MIRKAVLHRFGKRREEGLRVEGGRDEDRPAGGRIARIDEAVRGAAGNADDIASFGEEAAPVDLVEVASGDDANDLRFPMATLGRTFSGRIDGFDEAEFASARGGR